MQIDKQLLSEKNYTGSRLILIEDEMVTTLQKELSSLQQEINPILDTLSKDLYAVIDPLYKEVQEHQAALKELKEQIMTKQAEFAAETATIEAVEQKAQLVKNKMQPLIRKAIEGKLEEFEEAKHTVVKDGKIYAEVFDKLEETIKAYRATKQK